MKKILFVVFLALFLVSCPTPQEQTEQAGGLEDFKTAKEVLNQGNNDEAIRLYTKAKNLASYPLRS